MDLEGWRQNNPTEVYLVALDVVGFSQLLDSPVRLAGTRTLLLSSVQSTSLYPSAKLSKAVAVHFLGDELRIAFRCSVISAVRALSFTRDVVRAIKASNTTSKTPTRVTGALIKELATPKIWNKCRYLDGCAPATAQRLMDYKEDDVKLLQPGEFVTNRNFYESGECTHWRSRTFGKEQCWVVDMFGETPQ